LGVQWRSWPQSVWVCLAKETEDAERGEALPDLSLSARIDLEDSVVRG
jgi:hypothetical protein